MKFSTAILFCSLFLCVSSESWFSFLCEAYKGSRDMWRAYSDMAEAGYPGSEQYFISRGNYDAARRGPGGAWAAKVISNAREGSQRITNLFKDGNTRHSLELNSRANQFASEWGRSGKSPEFFHPRGLPEKYPPIPLNL